MNMGPMKIWVICQYYPPEVGAPSARISGLARSWVAPEDGSPPADVTVLTGIPNHPDGVVPPEYQGMPACYEETLSGVRIRRHWLYVARNKGKWPRLFNMLSFAGSVWWFNRRAAVRPDVIMATSPTFFCVMSAWLLARRHGAKFVFEVRDLWPAIFVQMGLFQANSLVVKVLSALEMFMYRRADAIVTVTRSFAREIAARGIPAEKISVVFNGVSDADYAAAAAPRTDGRVAKLRSTLGLGALTKIVLYIGNHGEAQALGQVVDAARLLVKRTDVQFIMVGSGADKERLMAYGKGIPNLRFLPGVSHAEVYTYYALADVNIVCLKNIPDFAMFIPSKMFEIMAAESAAVAALQGEGAEIMQESGCALVVPSEDPENLARALETLLDDPTRRASMAAAGRAFVARTFLHSQLAAGYRRLLAGLVAGQAPRA
jgi:glycosyltransferase involved in cell wall biosynthesis